MSKSEQRKLLIQHDYCSVNFTLSKEHFCRLQTCTDNYILHLHLALSYGGSESDSHSSAIVKSRWAFYSLSVLELYNLCVSKISRSRCAVNSVASQ